MILSDKPFFTVVIPVYNRSFILSKTLQSVLRQTFEDFDIIVVDDGSKDHPETVCAGINDPRLRVIRQENGGASKARNTGIDAANGRYVALLDSDDAYLPTHLEAMKALIDLNPDAVVYSPVIADRGRGRSFIKPPRAIHVGENMANYLMRDRGFVQTSGLCLPTDVARRVRYREDASYGDDTDFAVRLQLSGCNFVMKDVPTVLWSDGVEHERLSDIRTPLTTLQWLDDLEKHIPHQAYQAYRGWHLAKSLASQRPFRALWLYITAVFSGAYAPRLALVVLMQILLPNHLYRRLTNFWIERRVRKEKENEAT